ncbi:MAG: NHL repeat-containing protein [bacterium]
MKRFSFSLCLLIIFILVSSFLLPKAALSQKRRGPDRDKSSQSANQEEDVVANKQVKFIGTLDCSRVQNVNGVQQDSGIIIDLAQNSQGEYYLLKDLPPRVMVFNRDGKFLFQFGEKGDRPGQIGRPFTLAIDNKDRVFICDVEREKIMVFDPSGKFLEEFSSRSALAESDRYKNDPPGCIAIEKKSSRLYISDPANGHVTIHDLKGKFLQYFKGEKSGMFCTPGIVRFDNHERVYVPEGLCDRIRVFKQDGTELLKIGESGDMVGQFSRLTGMAVDSQGRIYASDLLLKCIQVFNSEGECIGVIKWLDDDKGEKIFFKRVIRISMGNDDSLLIMDQGTDQVYIVKDAK